MNWMADINWESVLVASIIPVLGLVGLIYQEYRKRKNAKDSAAENAAAKREPTWNELVTENRNLRDEVTELNKQFATFQSEFTAYKAVMSRKMDALVELNREASAQWPEGHEGPVFNADTLGALEDTEVPVKWRGRVRPEYGYGIA